MKNSFIENISLLNNSILGEWNKNIWNKRARLNFCNDKQYFWKINKKKHKIQYIFLRFFRYWKMTTYLKVDTMSTTSDIICDIKLIWMNQINRLGWYLYLILFPGPCISYSAIEFCRLLGKLRDWNRDTDLSWEKEMFGGCQQHDVRRALHARK